MTGWKPIPISLKILSVVLLLWTLMTIGVLIKMPDREIAFFGLLLKGTSASIIVLLLDVISPLLFLYALWNKLKWGAKFGLLYNGIFILNSIVALFTYFDVFGNGIYFPLGASAVFFLVILSKRKYFSSI